MQESVRDEEREDEGPLARGRERGQGHDHEQPGEDAERQPREARLARPKAVAHESRPSLASAVEKASDLRPLHITRPPRPRQMLPETPAVAAAPAESGQPHDAEEGEGEPQELGQGRHGLTRRPTGRREEMVSPRNEGRDEGDEDELVPKCGGHGR